MPPDIYRFADFELDRSAYQLRRKGRPVGIERIPLDLLFLLAERPGQLVTRDEIRERIWGKDVFLDSDHSINIAVQKIRQVLKDDPETPRFVATVPTKGYRFVATLLEKPVVGTHRDDENGVRPQPSAMVGRERELAELRAGLADATAGCGRLILISGEPGIGKTRLSAELAAFAQAGGMAVRTGQCLDREEAVPYLPFVEILESCFDRSSDPRELRKLVGNEGPELARLMPRLGRLLPELAAPLDLPPRETRRHLFNSFCDFAARLATERPTLFTIEDLHWADDSTLSLLDHLVKRLSKLPLLMVGTFREAELDVSPRLARTLEDLLRGRLANRIRLKGLPRDDVAEMLTTLSGMSPPAGVVREIYDETGGNPFFVEELFLHLKEENRLYDSLGDFLPELKIGELDAPQSVRMVVGRRLARLSDLTRKCMVTMAAIGRSFSFEVLEATSGTDAESLLESVVEAERAGLIFSSANNGKARFDFSHELIRQAVLGSLSAALRERLHLQVAEAIEQVYCDVLDDHVSELAHHYGRSANVRKAVLFQRLAGAQAARRFAFREAAAHLRSALENTKSLPDSPQRSREELALLNDLSNVVMIGEGFGAPELERIQTRALALGKRVGKDRDLLRALVGALERSVWTMDLLHAQEFGEEALALAQRTGRTEYLARAHGSLSRAFFFLGQLTAARTHAEQALTALRGEAPERESSLRNTTRRKGLKHLVEALFSLGYPDQAISSLRQSVDLGRRSGPFGLACTLEVSAWLFSQLGQPRQGLECAEEALALCSQHDFLSIAGFAEVNRGSALILLGRLKEGFAQTRRGVASIKESGSIWAERFVFHANACWKMHQPAEGLASVEEGLVSARATGRVLVEADLHRVRGDLLLIREPPDEDEAERCFEKAIDVSRKLDAKWCELGATMSLARLLARQGKRDEARAMLAVIYNWFTEGFDTADLKDAKALLEELSNSPR